VTARLIDGVGVARRIREEVAEAAGRLARGAGTVPGLAAVLVGDDPASATYVAMKERACHEVGFHSRIVRREANTTQDELLGVVRALNEDPAIHGILVQLPLPRSIDARAVTETVDPAKDVDGFHPVNVGRLAIGDLETGYVPATPAGVLRLLREEGVELRGAEAVVVGRSGIVGKPVALLLLHQSATVTVCHRSTRDLAAVTRRADVLVVAVGRPGTITAEMVKPGAVVIDVGVNRVPDPSGPHGHRLVGDVDPDVREVAGRLTPVPGGVGPMTIAMLLENTLKAATRAAGIES
jgi:methylenetetrahydrofolate dehydrogenase (NADP+)/methenyltetrahydrofolate cyclohydrolase